MLTLCSYNQRRLQTRDNGEHGGRRYVVCEGGGRQTVVPQPNHSETNLGCRADTKQNLAGIIYSTKATW